MMNDYAFLGYVQKKLKEAGALNVGELLEKLDQTDKNVDKLTTFQSFGSNYPIGFDNYSPNEAAIDRELAQLALIKPRPLLLCFHVRKDSNGVLRIVQFGFNSTGHSEARVDYAVNKLLSMGFTIAGIKVHPTGSSTTSYTFDAQYMTDYTALVNQLATKFQGKTNNFIVTNEFPEVTGNSAFKTQLQTLISSVKAKGFKAGMSMINIGEMVNCVVLDDLDLYGINSYPYIGTKGLSTTDDEVVAAWERSGYLQTFADLKKKYPNKQTFITETGTTDKIISLEYPAYWNTSSYPDNNGNILGRYWSGTFKALKNLPYIDMVFGWDGGTYSPYQYEYSLNIMKKEVGEPSDS